VPSSSTEHIRWCIVQIRAKVIQKLHDSLQLATNHRTLPYLVLVRLWNVCAVQYARAHVLSAHCFQQLDIT
jgi:hypothetical protein